MVSPQVVSEAPKIEVIQQPAPDEAAAKADLLHKESGNVACKINGGAIDCNYNGHRACGIGQALPCQKLIGGTDSTGKVWPKVCNLSDYACQDTFFTDYMKQRYSTWTAALAYWHCTGYCTNNYGTIYKETTWW